MTKGAKWTQEEVDFVINNMELITEKQMAKILNRTEYAIKQRKKMIRRGQTIVGRGKDDKRCPCCKSGKAVNEVTTYDPHSYNTLQAYYCMKCGIEFRKNGKIIPYTKREALGGIKL